MICLKILLKKRLKSVGGFRFAIDSGNCLSQPVDGDTQNYKKKRTLSRGTFVTGDRLFHWFSLCGSKSKFSTILHD